MQAHNNGEANIRFSLFCTPRQREKKCTVVTSTYQSFVITKILFLFLFNYERIAETILVVAGRVVGEGNVCCAVWAERKSRIEISTCFVLPQNINEPVSRNLLKRTYTLTFFLV